MVSLADVVKREKLTAHLDSISGRLQNDGFIADAAKHDFVYITTWGIEEVKRVTQKAAPPEAAKPAPVAAPPPPPEPPKAVPPPEPPKAEAKNAAELRQAAERARELAQVLEEVVTAGGTPAQRRAKAKKALAAATAAVEKAFA